MLKEELLDHYKLSQTQSNEQPIPDLPEENECSEYGNGYSSVGSSVMVSRPTHPETLPNLEAEAFYVTPKSHGRLAPNADIGRIPNQRHTRPSTRLSERRRREDRD